VRLKWRSHLEGSDEASGGVSGAKHCAATLQSRFTLALAVVPSWSRTVQRFCTFPPGVTPIPGTSEFLPSPLLAEVRKKVKDLPWRSA
jgi:hypothetical protein